MELKKYNFDFNVLDDHGKPQHQRLASATEVAKRLDGKLTSPSEHIWRLVEAEQDKFPQLDQKTALERVQKRNPELFRLYASESNGRIHVVPAS